MYRVGTSKVDITIFKDNCGMLGYGRHFHFMKGVETPQYARAFVFENNGTKVVFLVVDYCFTTIYLKHGIINKLQSEFPEMGYHDANVMITAQHTHSTAGGYTQHLIYNMTIPGFQQDIYDHYRDGIVKAIVEADRNLQDANIFYHKGEFDKDAEVAFNRSVAPYNENPEVTEKIGFKNRHLAVDREMKLLRFNQKDGKPIGSLNWFGVHTTSVSNRYDKVCYDNKGYAADFFEEWLAEQYGHEHKINAGFAQDATGDISPNFNWNPKLKEYHGKYKDDYESAAYNGRLQFNKAKEIFEESEKVGDNLNGQIDYILAYFDMTDIEIAEEYTAGLKRQKTGPACMGMSFLEGTTDGQGTPKVIGSLAKFFIHSTREVEILSARLSRNNKRQVELLDYYNSQRPKAIAMNLSRGSIVMFKKPERLLIPGFIDPTVKYIKYVNRVGKGVRSPWVEEKLPLQIFIVGQIAIVGIPSEITTIASKRLKNSILEVLKQRGVKEIIVSPYANGYAGYITTPEEYKLQNYEGGHTLFGRWTLPAYQIKFKELATELLKFKDERKYLGVEPQIFDQHEIWTGFDDPKIRVWKR
jgi:neutral ceramidase